MCVSSVYVAGGAPHQLRAMAEALDRTVAASKYAPDLVQHAIMGSTQFAKAKDRQRYRSERNAMRSGEETDE